MRIDLNDHGDFRKLRKTFQHLSPTLYAEVTKKGLRKVAVAYSKESARLVNFRARRPLTGLASTFWPARTSVVVDRRKNVVYSNYGDADNKHGHLIERGTKNRSSRTRRNLGRVKPHLILRRAVARKSSAAFAQLGKDMQRSLDDFMQRANRGEFTAGERRQAARLPGT